jgi:hypothetical protein
MDIIHLPFENKRADFGYFSKYEKNSAPRTNLIKGSSIEKGGPAQLVMCRSDFESQNFSKYNFTNSKSVNSVQEETIRSRNFINDDGITGSKHQLERIEESTNKTSFSNSQISVGSEKSLNGLKFVHAGNAPSHPIDAKKGTKAQKLPDLKTLSRTSSVRDGLDSLISDSYSKKSNIVFPAIVKPINSLALKLSIPKDPQFTQSKVRIRNQRKQCCLFFY